MIRNLLKTALAAMAVSTPLQICAEPAELDKIVATAAIGQVSLLQYDHSGGSLLGVSDSTLLRINVAGGTLETIAQLDSAIIALAVDPSVGGAAIITANSAAIQLINVENGAGAGMLPSGIGSPGTMTFDGSTGQFAVASNLAPELSLVPADGGTLRQVSLPGPVSELVANGRGWLFATAADRSAVYVVDVKNGTSLGQFPVAGCDEPGSPVIDDIERRLYVACGNGLLFAIDSDTGVVLSRIPIPDDASDLVLADNRGRTINIVVATQSDGIWLASGRITAQSAARMTGNIDGLSTLARGPGDSVFVVHDQSISRLQR